MSSTGDLRVSSRGQMSLPSTKWHRWGLDEGGDVGDDAVRKKLLASLTSNDWELARAGFGDHELASQ
jgi:hypothetical protein